MNLGNWFYRFLPRRCYTCGLFMWLPLHHERSVVRHIETALYGSPLNWEHPWAKQPWD